MEPAVPVVAAGLLLLGTVVLATPLLDGVLPAGALGLLRRNSEALIGLGLLALDLWVVPRDRQHALWRWWVGALVLTGVVMLGGRPLGLPDAFVTLNEPVLATAAISVWLRRPGRTAPPDAATGVALVVLVGLVVVAVAMDGTRVAAAVVQQAETIGLLVVGVLVADVLYAWPGRHGSRIAPWWVRGGATIALLAVQAVGDGGDGTSAASETAARFLGRLTEAVLVGVVLIVLAELAKLRARGATRSPSTEARPPRPTLPDGRKERS